MRSRTLVAIADAGVATVRAFAMALVATMTLAASLAVAAPATADPAQEFMQQTANALIDAQRSGSPEAFARVVKRYGHIPAIGMDALGTYRTGLRAEIRESYYDGLVKFIARYAATEGLKYPVTRAEFPTPGTRDGQHVTIDSRIYLKDGSTYDVRWLLVPRGKSFRVRDAQVMGFWVSPFLTRLFENYIGENGGKIDALVMALNR